MKDLLSFGCQRALDLAYELAWRDGFENPAPKHCLKALLFNEEGPVANLFKELGVSETQLAAFKPHNINDFEPFPIPPLGKERLQKKIHSISKKKLGEQEGTSLGFLIYLLEEPDLLIEELKPFGLNKTIILEKISLFEEEPLTIDPSIFQSQERFHDSTFRILDAAANRVREGLRVVEDYCRFELNHANLCSNIKNLRHDFRESLRWIDPNHLISNRSTETDIGKDIHTEAEFNRPNARETAVANLKRVQESLRSLEEYGKQQSKDFAWDISKIRYRSYEFEQQFMHVTSVLEKLKFIKIYALLSVDQLLEKFHKRLHQLLESGIDMVQLRLKNISDKQLYQYAEQAKRILDPIGIPLIINDRADICVAIDADGVHLGQEDMPASVARSIIGSNKILGISTHNLKQFNEAEQSGLVDYAGVGPIFPTQTKNFDTSLPGTELIELIPKETPLPWFAIGGINRENIHTIASMGVKRVAISSGIFNAEIPLESLRIIREQLL